MGQKAILTGATGFVGSNLCRKLLDQNWHVSIITRKSSNLLNLEDLKDNVSIYEHNNILDLINFFKKENADVVFHLASLFISEHDYTQIDALVESNLRFGLHILEAMKESGTNLMINTGTSWQHYHTDEYNPVNLYAATKEAYEKLIQYYIEAEGLRVITLKLFDTYGETDKRPKLINLLCQYAYQQNELRVSPGEQTIDLVHVDDVTNAFIKAYDHLSGNKNLKYNVYSVGTGKSISLKKLISLFEDLTGERLNIIWGGRQYRKREVMELWRDCEGVPNWRPKILLEEGIKKIVDKEKPTRK